MKYDAHIPVEQYGYLGFSEFEGTAEEAYEKYLEIREVVKPKIKAAGPGLDRDIYNKAYDEYLMTGELANGTELDAQMNHDQQIAIQELKKSKRRINK